MQGDVFDVVRIEHELVERTTVAEQVLAEASGEAHQEDEVDSYLSHVDVEPVRLVVVQQQQKLEVDVFEPERHYEVKAEDEQAAARDHDFDSRDWLAEVGHENDLEAQEEHVGGDIEAKEEVLDSAFVQVFGLHLVLNLGQLLGWPDLLIEQFDVLDYTVELDVVPHMDQGEDYIVKDEVDDEVEHVADEAYDERFLDIVVQAIFVVGYYCVSLVFEHIEIDSREQHFTEKREAKRCNHTEVRPVKQLAKPPDHVQRKQLVH